MTEGKPIPSPVLDRMRALAENDAYARACIQAVIINAIFGAYIHMPWHLRFRWWLKRKAFLAVRRLRRLGDWIAGGWPR